MEKSEAEKPEDLPFDIGDVEFLRLVSVNLSVDADDLIARAEENVDELNDLVESGEDEEIVDLSGRVIDLISDCRTLIENSSKINFDDLIAKVRNGTITLFERGLLAGLNDRFIEYDQDFTSMKRWAIYLENILTGEGGKIDFEEPEYPPTIQKYLI